MRTEADGPRPPEQVGGRQPGVEQPGTGASHPAQPRSSPFTVSLLGIALAAAAGRIAWVQGQRHLPPSSDGWAYSHVGLAVADGAGFVNPLNGAPTALHPPGWSLLLAVASWLGVDTLTGHQLVAALLGAVTVVLVGLLGRRLAGPRAGLLAALLAAVHPGLWVWERELAAITAAMPLLVAVVLVAYRFVERPSLGLAAAMGALVGLLVLVRTEQALLLVVLVGALVLLRPWAPVRRRLAAVALAWGVALAVMSPWLAYNHGRFEEPVLLTTGAGVTLRYANSPATYHGPLLGYGDPAVWEALVPGDESQADPVHRRVGLDQITAEPERLPAVLLARQGRTWGVFHPRQQAELDRSWGNSPTWVYLAGTLVTWASLPLAVAGAARLRREGTTLVPLLALVAVSVVNAAVAYGQPRYRVPADLALVVLASAGLDALLSRRSDRRSDAAGAAEVDLPGEEPARDRVGVGRTGVVPGPGRVGVRAWSAWPRRTSASTTG